MNHGNKFRHPAHDDEQQQHAAAAAATTAVQQHTEQQHQKAWQVYTKKYILVRRTAAYTSVV